MDYDIISNISQEEGNVTNATVPGEWVVYTHEVVFSVISILSLAADSLIIHTIRTNASLKSPTNIYVMHIAALDVVYLICLPGNWMTPFYDLLRNVYCITIELEVMFQCCTIMLLIAFSTDFGVMNHTYQKIIVGVWIFAGINSVICIIYCTKYTSSSLPLLLATLGFVVLFAIHVVHGAKKCRRVYDEDYKYRFVLVSVYVAIWTPNWICTFIFFTAIMTDTLFNVYLWTAGLGYFYGLANVIGLAYLDKSLKLIFLQTLTCSKNKYIEATVDEEYRVESIVEIDLTIDGVR